MSSALPTFPLSSNDLSRWTRFATLKKGIGIARAVRDRTAKEEEELMFLAGEEIVVLCDLGEREVEGDGEEEVKGESGSGGGVREREYLVSQFGRLNFYILNQEEGVCEEL
jgi:hypothetical protein